MSNREELASDSNYLYPDIFAMYALAAEGLGFTNTASAPLVRSSYHADQQAHGAGVA